MHAHHFAFFSTVAGYPWAGSEVLWSQAAGRALARGHAVTAMLHPDMQGAATVLGLEKSGAQILTRRNLAASWRLRGLQARLSPDIGRLMKKQPNLVVVSLGGPWDFGWIPGLAAGLQQSGIPYVLLVQFAADTATPSPELRREARELYSKARAVIFVSRQNREVVQRQLGTGIPRGMVLANPVPDSLQGRSVVPWPEDKNGLAHFASVARLEALWKGQDLLLETLAQPAWRQRPWRLRLYGRGPDEQYIRELIAHHHLRDRVELAGHVENVQALWQNEQLLVLPSRGEGLPLVLLEAMACGRPAVVTDVGGNAELIEEGQTGFLAEAPTLRSFGAALERAWEARTQWETMGRHAHATVLPIIAADPAAQLIDHLELWLEED